MTRARRIACFRRSLRVHFFLQLASFVVVVVRLKTRKRTNLCVYKL